MHLPQLRLEAVDKWVLDITNWIKWKDWRLPTSPSPLAMAQTTFFTVLLLMMVCASPAASTLSPEMESVPGSFAFELVLLLIIILLGSTCCLLMKKDGGPGTCSFQKAIKVADAGVQCNLDQGRQFDFTPPPPTTIDVTTHGGRWHERQDCRHLKSAGKVCRMTPCATCSA